MFLRLVRWVPATGILFAVLVLVSTLLTSDTPGASASDAEVAAYYADDGNRSAELVSFVLIGLAAFCFLTFLGSLRGALARTEGEPARITTAVVASGAVFIALAVAAHTVGTSVSSAVEYWDEFEVDPNTARLTGSLSYWFFAMSMFAAASMTASASILALWLGGLPRWLGYFGLAATLGGLLGILGWPSLLVLAWIVLVSGYLTWPRRAETEVPPAT